MNIPYVFKKCSKCGEWLVANSINFSKDKTCKYGLMNRCKKCDRKQVKQYHQQHKEEIQQYMQQYGKQYRKEHKEKIQQYQQQYNQQHKKEKQQYQQQYHQQNKEQINKQHKQRYNNIKNGTHKVNPKKTQEQFIQELHEVNPDIEILETYKGSAVKIKVRCKIDGHIWEPTPNTLLRGHGCPKCKGRKQAKQRIKSHDQFIKEMEVKYPTIQVLGTYKGNRTKIKCKCKVHDYIWESRPNNLLNGHGCPKCGNHVLWTHDEFIKELAQRNPDIEVLGIYTTALSKIKVRCKIDNYEWEVTPATLLFGSGCPKCGITKGEKIVAQYLDNIGISYIYNKCYFKDLRGVNGGLMKPDFIIPSLKIWIEYDGIQHFKPVDFTSKMSEQEVQEQFKITQQHDQIKNEYAQQHNWTLIRIPYWDYDNIEQILDAVIKQKEAI